MKYLLVLLFLSNFSNAETMAILNLKGTIAGLLEISIEPEALTTVLPLGTTQSNTKIATITERSNKISGYKITITSQNLGKLVNNENNFVNYNLTYNNQAIDLTILTGSVFNINFTNTSPKYKDVKISYTGVDVNSLVSGDYVDSVTFTISEN